MKLFECQGCSQLVYFENSKCEGCSRRLGYLPHDATMSALEPHGQQWRALASPGRTYRFCENAQFDVCNWLVADDWDERLCMACRHNRTIPNHTQPENLILWRKLEVAKHRLFYTLLRLGLPLANRDDNPAEGLAFDFIADTGGDKVMTGHDDGIITIALREAHDVEREQQRHDMREAYRTTLGHFRHEIGHYYWDRLVKNDASIDRFRELFGDEREDYDAALQRHYGQGSKTQWQERFVSAYASAHPWEDFAETWAHYLHIIDSLESAGSFGLQIHPKIDKTGDLHTDVNFDPHHAKSMDQLIEAWLPVTFAANSLARSMGQPDLYPFILSPTVIAKLGMVHDLIHQRVGRTIALSSRSAV